MNRLPVNSRMFESIFNDFGRFVKTERKAAGYSQEYFAELTNLHRNTVNAIEKGLTNAELLTINNICLVLKLSQLSLDFRQGKLFYRLANEPFTVLTDVQIYKKFGIVIDNLRKLYDISRERLSYQIDIHRNTIARIENGATVIRCNTVLTLYNYFGFTDIFRIPEQTIKQETNSDFGFIIKSKERNLSFNLIHENNKSSAQSHQGKTLQLFQT